MIELRSDTFTLQTPEMLYAMSKAPLGDDVYHEDPTVRLLEEKAAHLLGKEAACLMPSGTMANLSSLLAHCPRGTRVIVGDESDIYVYEAGGASVCGGLVYDALPTQADGRLLPCDMIKSFPEDPTDAQFALPALLCLENTHNRCGGVVLSLSYLQEMAHLVHSYHIPLHLDGARIFNASVALGVPVAQIAGHADSVQFCLSKGLGAPIGSIVVGGRDFIRHVHRIRKMLGGGMRQAGIVAAAGIVALDQMIHRLADDHAHAQRLARGLAGMAELHIHLDTVQTNIVLFRVVDERFTWKSFIKELHLQGVNISELGGGLLRAVTHYGITTADIDRTLESIEKILRQGPLEA